MTKAHLVKNATTSRGDANARLTLNGYLLNLVEKNSKLLNLLTLPFAEN